MTALTVDQVLTGAALGLTTGLADILVLEIGGRRVLYSLSRSENKLIEIDIESDGSLTVVGAIDLQGTFPAGSEPLLGTVSTENNETYLTLAGLPVADGQTVSLLANGALGGQQPLSGIGVLTASAGFDLTGTAAMISAGQDSGLNLYTDSGGGFGWTAGLNDTDERYLADISASVAFEDGGIDYVATVSSSEDGVNIASVVLGSLNQTGALGATSGLPVDQPSDIGVLQRLDETLLVIASIGTNSVSVVRVTGGSPVLADHILDAEQTQFLGANSISALTYGDFAFVGVGGAEGGVSLLTVLPGGRLVHLASFADDETTTLADLSSVELTVVDSTLQIYGASFWEAGVTRLTYDVSGLGSVVQADGTGSSVIGTSGDDQIIGSDVSEAVAGGVGDDILLDGAGNDVLTGGAGADLFVMSADGQADTITDFERSVDQLDLSAFDFLYDISQLGVTPTTDGAILTHGSETITIITSDGAPLTAADLSISDILNVDRPPFLAVGQELLGGAEADTLNGGMGADTITGAEGDDSLSGGFGDDSLLGGAGFDSIDGGAGNDTVSGQSDGDTLIGGAGNDLIFGDDGDDVIYGDDWQGA